MKAKVPWQTLAAIILVQLRWFDLLKLGLFPNGIFFVTVSHEQQMIFVESPTPELETIVTSSTKLLEYLDTSYKDWYCGWW